MHMMYFRSVDNTSGLGRHFIRKSDRYLASYNPGGLLILAVIGFLASCKLNFGLE